jgi:rubredoxin
MTFYCAECNHMFRASQDSVERCGRCGGVLWAEPDLDPPRGFAEGDYD